MSPLGTQCLYPEDTEGLPDAGPPAALAPVLGPKAEQQEPEEPQPKYRAIAERRLVFPPAPVGTWRRSDYMIERLRKMLPPNPVVQVFWDEMYEEAERLGYMVADHERYDAMIEKVDTHLNALQVRPPAGQCLPHLREPCSGGGLWKLP